MARLCYVLLLRAWPTCCVILLFPRLSRVVQPEWNERTTTTPSCRGDVNNRSPRSVHHDTIT